MKIETKIIKKGFDKTLISCPNCKVSGHVYFNKKKMAKIDTVFKVVDNNKVWCTFCETDFEVVRK